MSLMMFTRDALNVKRVGVTMFVAFFCFLFLTQSVHAVSKKGFEALMVKTPSLTELTFAPGERKEVHVAFQNIGEKAWVNDGAGYVSIYTQGPKYRRSSFDPGTWLGPTQVKRLVESRVLVGEVGTMRFELHAPETEGEYIETFQLASEDTTWIPGGEFTLRVRVVEGVKGFEGVEGVKGVEEEDAGGTNLSGLLNEEATPRVGAMGYDASVLLRSAKKVVTPGGVRVTYTIGMKNAGTAIWNERRVQLPGVAMATSGADLVDTSWVSSSLLAVNSRGSVKPGELDFVTFSFTAPRTLGEHLVAFKFTVDGKEVEGGDVIIPVDVTSGAPDAVASPLRDGVMNKAEMAEEPIMRVGILIIDEETNDEIVVGCDCDVMTVADSEGKLLADVPRGNSVTAYVKAGKYFYDVGRGAESSTHPIRFIPDTENAVLTIQNFDRRVTRGSANTDNQFRNVLEMRYNAKKDRTWVINELRMEMYLRGLAETSNVSPMEYQKTMVTAARTYAYYHFQRSTKHAAEGFMVDAYVDQVYKGYGQEVRMPRLVEAIEETYGVTVTYDGQTAITPYFSRSDGRTRDWSEVWAGNIAWLKGIAVPCDAGKTLWGHGIGISASGAICLANEGMLYKDILKYFYTGVDVRRDWVRKESAEG